MNETTRAMRDLIDRIDSWIRQDDRSAQGAVDKEARGFYRGRLEAEQTIRCDILDIVLQESDTVVEDEVEDEDFLPEGVHELLYAHYKGYIDACDLSAKAKNKADNKAANDKIYVALNKFSTTVQVLMLLGYTCPRGALYAGLWSTVPAV